MADPRAGFSLAEALVVLAITSALLVLLFSVAGGATAAGFRLAGGALAASDRAVGAESLRVLLRGVRLPSRNASDPAFEGEGQALQAAVTPARSTACTGAAPDPALRLQLIRAGAGTRVVCAPRGGAGALTLLELKSPAAFSYALAGRGWSERLSLRPPPAALHAPPAPAPTPRLWVRLATDDGAFELIEAVEAAPARGGSFGR